MDYLTYFYIMKNEKTMKTQISKIYKAHQIMMAFELLGIDKTQFSNLKKQHGSLDGLYNWIETQLS